MLWSRDKGPGEEGPQLPTRLSQDQPHSLFRLASAGLKAPASHSPPSRGAEQQSRLPGCSCLQRTLSFPECSFMGQATQMCWSSLCFLYFFILLWFQLMLLSSQTLAHPGAPGGRVLLAAGEGRNHIPACAHPGFRCTGARCDGPHGQGPSHHLPVHSCRSPRSSFRRCDLHTCEDVAAASHMPGPRQGSLAQAEARAWEPQAETRVGVRAGARREPEKRGPWPVRQVLQPLSDAETLRAGAEPRPLLCPAPSPQQTSNKKAIVRVIHRPKVAQPHKVTSSQKLHPGSFCFSRLVHQGGPLDSCLPHRSSRSHTRPQPPVSTRSDQGGDRGSEAKGLVDTLRG